VIVDPGVGTQRRPLLVSGEKQYFVAPDNGVLSMIFERESCIVRHITSQHYFLNPSARRFTAGHLRSYGRLAFQSLSDRGVR